MNIGIQVSFLFSSDLSERPIADIILEIITTINAHPQIKIPPIVGVPAFFACIAENIGVLSPVNASSLICLPRR